MMIGMALGFLYLGGATWTLCTSNQAVAALVTSLFSVFPVTTVDNVFHLQALRHLWVLAAEQRYVCAIDAETRNPVKKTPTFLLFGVEYFFFLGCRCSQVQHGQFNSLFACVDA
jgi:hypothetical protein